MRASRLPARRFILIGIEPEAQRLGADEGNEIALPLPGRRIAQGGDQIIVGLRAIRRAGPVLHRAGDEDHGIARDRKLALAALAPEFEYDFAGIADLQIRY